MKRRLTEVCLGILLLGLLSCGDVNVYITFEAPKAERAIQAINDEVYGPKKAAPPAPEKTAPEKAPKTGEAPAYLPPWTGLVGVAYAGEAKLDVETPQIKAINRNRAQRSGKLAEWKGKGAIGEAKDGYVALVPPESSKVQLPLKQKQEVNSLIEAENSDRQELFKQLLKANKWSPDDMPKLQALFAKDLREREASGNWVQQADGKWEKKR